MEDSNMKKTYKAPALEVVKIQSVSLLAGSGDERSFTISNEEETSGWAD